METSVYSSSILETERYRDLVVHALSLTFDLPNIQYSYVLTREAKFWEIILLCFSWSVVSLFRGVL